MMVVIKCDEVVKKWVVGAKKHDGPMVVKKQVMVVKKKKVDAKNAGGYEKMPKSTPYLRHGWAGPGQPLVGSGSGQVRHLGPRPHEGGARSQNSGLTLALLGSGRVGPRANQPLDSVVGVSWAAWKRGGRTCGERPKWS